MEAIALLEEVVKKDDAAFGAHHYLIHAYEGSKTPEKAWHDNARYAGLVTDIPHALHMPGHIYAQSDKITRSDLGVLGRRRRGAQVDRVRLALPAGPPRPQRPLPDPRAEPWRPLRRVDEVGAAPVHVQGEPARTLRQQPARRVAAGLLRSDQDRGSVREVGRDPGRHDHPRVRQAGAAGMAPLGHRSCPGQHRADRQREGDARRHAEGSDGRHIGQRADRDWAQELEATIAARSGDRKKAYELYRKAADREAAMLYTEPPSYPRPVVEGWGNVALALGDYATAEKATARRWRASRAAAAPISGLPRRSTGSDARPRRGRRARMPPGRGPRPTPTCRRCRSSERQRPRRRSEIFDATVAPRSITDPMRSPSCCGVKSLPSTVAARRPSRSTTAVCSEWVISPSSGQY